MQKNDFAAAEPLLQKAVAAKPGDYRAWFDLGYVYNATNRLPEAIEAYRKSVAAKPEVFESNLNLGLLLARQGQNAEAAKYLKAATQLKPTAHPDEALARAWQSLGRVEESLDPQQALAAYAEASKLDPENPEPHLSAAALLEKQNNLDAAARELQTAADLDPKSQVAISGLANVYIKQKKYPEAEAALRKLLAADPQNSNARVQLGRLLAEEGKNDEAAQELQKGLQADSNDGRAALELGTLYVKADKYGEAEQQFRIAVKSHAEGCRGAFRAGVPTYACKEISGSATGIAGGRATEAGPGRRLRKSCRGCGGKQGLSAHLEGAGLSREIPARKSRDLFFAGDHLRQLESRAPGGGILSAVPGR